MKTTSALKKNSTYITVIGSLIAAGCMSSCSNNNIGTKHSKNDLLPQEVVVKYEHEIAVSEDAEKIKGIDYVGFVSNLASKISDGTVKAYDPLDKSKLLDSSNIAYIFNSRSNRTVTIDENTLDTVVTEIPYQFDPSSVQKLVFREEWNFSKEKFSMTKNILQYAPIRIVKRNMDGNGFENIKQMLLWINCENKSDNRKLLAENVSYEFNLINQDNPEWMESLSINRFIDIILSQVLEGKSVGYDFFSDEKIALSNDIIRANLGASTETYYVEDEAKNVIDTVVVTGNIYPDEIQSVIFVEDWYIDENMVIYKEIKRIAPVRHYRKVNELAEEEILKKVPFIVDLN